MSYNQAKFHCIVNSFDLNEYDDLAIEEAHEESVNELLNGLEENGFQYFLENCFTFVKGNTLIKSIDLIYWKDERDEEEEDSLVETARTPVLPGNRKITEEIFNKIHELWFDEGLDINEIIDQIYDMFDVDLSKETVRRVKNCEAYSEYYNN